MKWTPHRYQEVARKHERDHPSAAEFLDMGLGKTVITLSALDDLIAGLNIRSALVVGPIRVIEDVWPVEVKKWDHLKHLKCVLIRGSPAQRKAALRQKGHIYLINYELLPWLVDELRKLIKKRIPLPFQQVVLDESSKMKSPKAKRFKKFKLIRPHVKRGVWLLTGTPRPNSDLDLWAQLYCCDMGKRLGPHFGMFRDRWFNFNQYTYELTQKPGASKQIRKRISDICLSMRSEDYLELPRLVENVVNVRMPAKAMRQYREFEKEFFLELMDTEVEAFNSASLSMKCRQMTSGAVYQDQEEGERKKDRKWTKMHDAKMQAVQDIVEDAQGEPIIIVYEFKHELARLRKMFPKAPWIGGGSKNASKTIRDWNKGKLPVLFIHPASVGHGVNLQFGGHTMVWTSMTWSLELFQQMYKRLHRQGQAKPVIMHMLVVPGTVDEDVRAALRAKHEGQASLLKALRKSVGDRVRKQGKSLKVA